MNTLRPERQTHRSRVVRSGQTPWVSFALVAAVSLFALMLATEAAQAQPSASSQPKSVRVPTADKSRAADRVDRATPSKPAVRKPVRSSPVEAARSRIAAAPPRRANSARPAARPAVPVKVSASPVVVDRPALARPSFGQLAGLRHTDDPLDLRSSVALVVDQQTNQILFSKNPQAVLPIASITKLMTALVVLESEQPLDEPLSISQEDVDTEKGSRSRLQVGTRLTRGQMLHLALMSSENRAANALGRHHPGGLQAFVRAMNAKAAQLGMAHTRYVEPTGLSSANQSSAVDLSILVKAASQHDLIRELSTSLNTEVAVGHRQLAFRNTNSLVKEPHWDIGLQKTGYIAEAGRCVVMQTKMAGRELIMILLDSAGRQSRVGDAERLRRWLGSTLSPLTQPL